MRIDDTETNLIEPVTIEEVKDYLGYDPTNGRDDDLLQRLISGRRALLEDVMDRIIVLRSLVAHPQRAGLVELPPDLQGVSGVTYHDTDGVEHSVDDYTVDLDRSTVRFSIDEEYRDISISFSSGFGIIPDAVKDALLVLIKAKNDRSTDDMLSTVRPSLQKYWREHI